MRKNEIGVGMSFRHGSQGQRMKRQTHLTMQVSLTVRRKTGNKTLLGQCSCSWGSHQKRWDGTKKRKTSNRREYVLCYTSCISTKLNVAYGTFQNQLRGVSFTFLKASFESFSGMLLYIS